MYLYRGVYLVVATVLYMVFCVDLLIQRYSNIPFEVFPSECVCFPLSLRSFIGMLWKVLEGLQTQRSVNADRRIGDWVCAARLSVFTLAVDSHYALMML